MRSCAVIIPALNPTESLVDYVKALDVLRVIIVNDGSRADLDYIFTELKTIEKCSVLTHDKNKGKGRALKTAFQFFSQSHYDLMGVITADADGQHSIEDVGKIAEVLQKNEDRIILGVRDFSHSSVPSRSYIGNRITSLIFHILFGLHLKDTQTGLRGIPTKLLPPFIDLKGERFEYEMNMLIYARKNHVRIEEFPIQTLYFNNNKSSHYHAIFDSFKIFSKLVSGVFMKTRERRK